MIKKVSKLLLLIIPLLFLSYCQRESEARIRIVNVGNVDIGVTIHNYTYRINAGQEDTLILTWPGRGELTVNMFVFAVNFADLFDNYMLVLNHNDYLEKELGYTVEL